MSKLVNAKDVKIGDVILGLSQGAFVVDDIDHVDTIYASYLEFRSGGLHTTFRPHENVRIGALKTATGRTKSNPELQNVPGATQEMSAAVKAAAAMGFCIATGTRPMAKPENEQIAELKAEVSRLKGEHYSTVCRKDEIAEQARRDMLAKDDEIKHLKEENADQATQLLVMYSENDVATAKLTMINVALDSRGGHIISLNQSLAEKEGEIAELQRQLALRRDFKEGIAEIISDEIVSKVVKHGMQELMAKQEPVEVVLTEEWGNSVSESLLEELEAALEKAGVKYRYE